MSVVSDGYGPLCGLVAAHGGRGNSRNCERTLPRAPHRASLARAVGETDSFQAGPERDPGIASRSLHGTIDAHDVRRFSSNAVCRSLAFFLPCRFPATCSENPACAARGTPPRRNAWIYTAIANCPASIVPSAAPRSTTDDLRPAPTLPDRSDQWLLTRPWYFRLSSFERSRARSPRAPTCAPDQRRADTIAFICLRTRNVPPFAVRTRREGKNKRAKGERDGNSGGGAPINGGAIEVLWLSKRT